MFRGGYQHTIDPKGRLSVPAKFRDALAQYDGALIVVPNDYCLEVHPLEEWQRIETKLREQPIFTPDVRELSRLYISRAKDVTLDAAGRGLIPPGVREQAGRSQEVPPRGGGVGSEAVRGIGAQGGGPAGDVVREALGPGSVAVHVPVLVDEVVFVLRPRDEGWVIDATVGMGGHAEAILSASASSVRLLALDTDAAALAQARERLTRFGDRVELAHASFRRLGELAAAHGVERARSILMDLGVSSWQLEQSGRGLSFQGDEPLDMRLDASAGQTAAALLNHFPEAELARLIFEYGEEPHARRIARAIVRRRPLARTGDLVAAVRGAVPRAAWPRRLHVATRTFQAVRMAVNDEPGALRN